MGGTINFSTKLKNLPLVLVKIYFEAKWETKDKNFENLEWCDESLLEVIRRSTLPFINIKILENLTFDLKIISP